MARYGSLLPKLGDLIKAARLTRNGQLQEAMSLVKKSLAGQSLSTDNMPHERRSDHVREVLGQAFNAFHNNTKAKDWTGFGLGDVDSKTAQSNDDDFVERSFSNTAGTREYKLFIPSEASGLRPLVIMLHGCTQSPDDFAAGTQMNELAQHDGIYVAYPRQTRGANAQKCWNWFETKDQGRERGEAGIIAGLTRAIVNEYPIDPARIYIAGLSAGGAAAANIAQAYPELFAGVGVHSGLAAGCARDLPSALMAMRAGASGSTLPGSDVGAGSAQGTTTSRVPTIIFHGGGDKTVNPRNGDEVLAQAGITDLIPRAEAHKEPGRYDYTRTRYVDQNGRSQIEFWRVDGAGHAWFGGSKAGSYTDPLGPDASRAMLDFFAQHRLKGSLDS